jgi:hypothetical protein
LSNHEEIYDGMLGASLVFLIWLMSCENAKSKLNKTY